MIIPLAKVEISTQGKFGQSMEADDEGSESSYCRCRCNCRNRDDGDRYPSCYGWGQRAKSRKVVDARRRIEGPPQIVYRYYIMLLDGQKCALYGADHSREPEQLSHLQLPVRVRVRGKLGTEHHSDGAKGNPSPFPEGWWVYMDVHDAEVLK